MAFLFEDKFFRLLFFKIFESLREGSDIESLVEREVKAEVEDMDEGFVELFFFEFSLSFEDVMGFSSFVGGCGGSLLEA